MPDYDLGLEGYRIEESSDEGSFDEAAVLAFWEREGAVDVDEAKIRINEVLLVAIDDANEVAAVSTVYLQRNPQLLMSFWHTRAYVGHAHRMSNLALALSYQGRDLLQHRYVRGLDTRASGLIYEVENEGLKRKYDEAVWVRLDFTFCGENAFGDHVLVHYFPGALVPGQPRPG